MAALTPQFRARWAFAAVVLGASLTACGGGSSVNTIDTASPSPTPVDSTSPASPSPSPIAAPTPAPPLAVLNLPACEASGVSGATDYQVGDGKAYTALDQVPWENLKAGDSVRLFYRATPYKGKFMITSTGTASAPIRVCGVRGPNNERPIIEGDGATTRQTQAYGDRISGTASFRADLESASLIMLKSNQPEYTSYPNYIQIHGLNLRKMHPSYSFRDSAGTTRPYATFGACININRGQNILIADNEISDCVQAVYTISKDEGDFSVTKNIRISGNYFWGNGITGDDHEHTTYTASQGLVIEFNRYGALRSGAMGNSIKDRSTGTVVRYNLIEDGAHAVDLVDANDFTTVSIPDPAYRSSFVYGNLIRKSGDIGSFIHYGGDQGDESLYRKGTLYFFNNTIEVTGSGAAIFQLSTTDEKAEVWNNVIYFNDSVQIGNRSLRASQDTSAGYTSGGIVNLGVNWISNGWLDSDIYHPVSGQLNGTANLITGTTAPFDRSTGVPLAGSALVDAGVTGPGAAAAYTVDYQLDSSFKPVARTVNGSRTDLGAVER